MRLNQFQTVVLAMLFSLSSIRAIGQPMIEAVLTIPVGGKENEIAVAEFQGGLDFKMNSGGDFFLLDYKNNRIKVFSNQGKFKYDFSIFSELMGRFHIYQDYVIILTHSSSMYVLNLGGEQVYKHHFGIGKPILNQCIFYENLIFLPVKGRDFFSKDMYAFKFTVVEKDSSKPASFTIAEVGLLENAYDQDRTYNFIPIEKEDYEYLEKLGDTEYRAQSKKFVVFATGQGRSQETEEYYVFLKENKFFKKLGALPEKLGVSAGAWGTNHNIFDNALFVASVKYTPDFVHPVEVIISKIDLTQIQGFPSVEPEWTTYNLKRGGHPSRN